MTIKNLLNKYTVCLLSGHKWIPVTSRKDVCERCGLKRYRITLKFAKTERFVTY